MSLFNKIEKQVNLENIALASIDTALGEIDFLMRRLIRYESISPETHQAVVQLLRAKHLVNATINLEKQQNTTN